MNTVFIDPNGLSLNNLNSAKDYSSFQNKLAEFLKENLAQKLKFYFKTQKGGFVIITGNLEKTTSDSFCLKNIHKQDEVNKLANFFQFIQGTHIYKCATKKRFLFKVEEEEKALEINMKDGELIAQEEI